MIFFLDWVKLFLIESKTAQEKSTQQSHLLQLAVRLRKRFIEELNQILPKMFPKQLSALPEKHLKDMKLNLQALSADKIKDMFSKNSNKMAFLPNKNREYVESVLKQN